MPRSFPTLLPHLAWLLSCTAIVLLTGCEQLGIETPETIAAARVADGKAVGGACRHAGRAIEDCYLLNKKVDRAAVFAGWRDMNDYMRENKIEVVAPVLAVQSATNDDGDQENAAPRGSGKNIATAAKH